MWFSSVGRMLDGPRRSSPVELFNDGDLLLLVDRMLQLRGLEVMLMKVWFSTVAFGCKTGLTLAAGVLTILLLMLGATCLVFVLS